MQKTDMRRSLLIGQVLLLCAFGLCYSSDVLAQIRETVKPVHIVQIYGRDTLEVGELETFRVRVNTPYAATYSWSISDGTELGGNPIVYRFSEPGLYRVVASVANPTGRDKDTLNVLVVGERPAPPPPVASKTEPAKPKAASSGKSSAKSGSTKPKDPKPTTTKAETAASLKSESSKGNYTWVVATYFQQSAANALANSYRAIGFRSTVFVDSGGKGSTVYRVTLGQFESENQALAIREELRRNGITNPMLHHL